MVLPYLFKENVENLCNLLKNSHLRLTSISHSILIETFYKILPKCIDFFIIRIHTSHTLTPH